MSQPVRRQSRPPAQGDWGIAVPFFARAMIIAVVGFWPAMVWHGYTDTGGWRWDIHSTIAEAVYFGVVAFIIGLVILGNRSPRADAPPAVKAVSPGPLPQPSPPAPRCYHPDAVPVDLSTEERVAWLCPLPPEGCGEQLPAEFGRMIRVCCWSLPGTLHQYNCPHLKGSPS